MSVPRSHHRPELFREGALFRREQGMDLAFGARMGDHQLGNDRGLFRGNGGAGTQIVHAEIDETGGVARRLRLVERRFRRVFWILAVVLAVVLFGEAAGLMVRILVTPSGSGWSVALGAAVGASVGAFVGASVGALVGSTLTTSVGAVVGASVAAGVAGVPQAANTIARSIKTVMSLYVRISSPCNCIV